MLCQIQSAIWRLKGLQGEEKEVALDHCWWVFLVVLQGAARPAPSNPPALLTQSPFSILSPLLLARLSNLC